MKRSLPCLFFIAVLILTINTSDLHCEKKKSKIDFYWKIAKSIGNRKEKLKLLDKIYKEFNTMEYTIEDNDFVNMIIFLSEEGSIRQDFDEKGMITNNFPDIRIKAIRVLGRLVNDQIRDQLISVLKDDKDLQVKTEALKALENIKDNKNGDVLSAINTTFRALFKPNSALIIAMIDTSKAIAMSDPALKQNAEYVLTEIQLNSKDKKVRNSAYDAIKEISKK